MVSQHVMIDPSLLIDREVGPRHAPQHAIDKLARTTRENPFLEFYIPESFVNVLQNREREQEWREITDYFGAYGEFPDRELLEYKLENVDFTTFSIRESPSDQRESDLEAEIWELNENRYSDEREKILQEVGAREGSEIVSEILVEELAFGLEMSPILSRLKKVFEDLSAAAHASTTISKEYANDAADRITRYLEDQLSRYRRELQPIETLEVAIKHKRTDLEYMGYKLALYRDALKDEIPLTNWLAAPSSLGMAWAFNQSGVFTGNLSSDAPALIHGGFVLLLLDP